MSLKFFSEPEQTNKFCKIANLRNESDVEQFFVLPLLYDLGYAQDYIKTKTTIKEIHIGKGKKRKPYRPDYVSFVDKKHLKPVLVVDAKHPDEDASDGVDDAQLYSFYLRKELDEPRPEQYCIGSNGIRTIVKHYDKKQILHDLDFDEIVDGNPKFEAFKAELSKQSLAKGLQKLTKPFEFIKPDTAEIKGIFEICHKIIWKKEFKNPQPAFLAFSKIMFTKLSEDKKLRNDPEIKKLIASEQPIPADKVVFSSHWIEQNELAGVLNPINNLFVQIRDELESKILEKKKKRIFDKDELIGVGGETIKAVVERLQHYDLYGIDEDLNGRLFETFLSATMRGKQLGQFFTPRTVVDFMTNLAEIQVAKDEANRVIVDRVIDACCGTGGFLIEAMAKMVEKINNPPLSLTLSGDEKEDLIERIKDENIFGIDAGEDPAIAKIARINMYLHGDGGSRIYITDALDKSVATKEGLSPESRAEREELKRFLVKEQTKFDVVLTNPPFAMSYSRKEKDDKRILDEYKHVIYYLSTDGKNKLSSSVKSNVLFLERYYDLLDVGGKLLTVIDESVLNTDASKTIRDFILDKFIVKAIISLPQWAFFQAESNAKTSILYLVKKRDEKEEQPYTFFAHSENIGFDKSKPDLAMNQLPNILDSYFDFRRLGNVPVNHDQHWSDKSKFFIKRLDKNLRRIHFEWLDPRHEHMQQELVDLRERKGYCIKELGALCKSFRGKTADFYVFEGVPIIKTRNVTNEGIDWNTDFVLRRFFEQHEDKSVQTNDLLLNSTGIGTLGRVALFEQNLDCIPDGHVSILRINDSKEILPKYLLYYLRSVFGQMQLERYTVGYTGQVELNKDDLKLVQVAYPESIEEQRELIRTAEGFELSAMSAKEQYLTDLSNVQSEFVKNLIA